MANAATLLRAARQAYGVTSAGVAPSAGDDLIGWLRPPMAVISGNNSALVGETADAIIIAPAGTQPPGNPDFLPNWVENLNAIPVQDARFPGRVHAGIRDATVALYPIILSMLDALPTGKPIWMGAHSLGGAICVQLACLIPGRSISGVLIAAPRAGDGAFAAAVNGKAHFTRYENQGDIVPTLPPIDYQAVGALCAIWQGGILAEYPAGWAHQVLLTALGGGSIAAHTIMPGGGYSTAIEVAA